MKKILTLSNAEVPIVGLGTFPLQGRKMADIIIEAVKVGYRLIDTSDDYKGEPGIGIACSELYDKTGLKREDIFLQTKISQDNSYDDDPLDGIWFNQNSNFQKRHTAGEIVRDKVKTSLQEMKTDYIDSLLIHYPYPGFYEEIWEELISLQKEGIVRYIGVSNFSNHHIDVLKKSGVMPFFNEMYFSPLCTRTKITEYSQQNDIQLICYSPLMGLSKRIPEETLLPLMQKYGKTKMQIILRWNIDRNCIPLPRTTNVSRLSENFDVLDFSLTKEEVHDISDLNKDFYTLPESRFCPGL